MSCKRGCCPTQLDHYKSIGIAAAALPTRGGARAAVSINEKERRWERDHKAVAECARMGVVPKQVDGTADLMDRASSKFEIEMGTPMNQRQKDQYTALSDVNEGKLKSIDS